MERLHNFITTDAFARSPADAEIDLLAKTSTHLKCNSPCPHQDVVFDKMFTTLPQVAPVT